MLEVALPLAAQRVERGVTGIGDDQPAGPSVGLVGHPPDQPLLDEDGDVPADGGRVGVHELGERALPQRTESGEREEQHEGGPVAVVRPRQLRLERVHQPHEAGELLAQGAHQGEPVDGVGRALAAGRADVG